MSVSYYEHLNEKGEKEKEEQLKVAAYCRVSTDEEDQLHSFENQQSFFQKYIQENPCWEFYGIFADEGISGTNTKKRKAFNRMIAEAKKGKFDLILTKEISRFARNTLDSIYYTRDLKQYGVGVLFLNDNICTLDGDGELRLAILSSIAQEESRRTSQRVKWGQKRRMEQGVVFGRDLLGYDVRGGRLYLNEQGAKIVRLIFHKFVQEGKGTYVIARELCQEKIPTVRNSSTWSSTAVLRILRNEKYCGDLVQKKTYTPDFLSHEKKQNQGQEKFVILKDHHEPIVSRELFEKANRILDERAQSQKGKGKYSSRFLFSGKICCGCCGSSYVARTRNGKNKKQYQSWRCLEAVQKGKQHSVMEGEIAGCSSPSITSKQALTLVAFVIRSIPYREKWMETFLLFLESKVKQTERMPKIRETVLELLEGPIYEDVLYREILEQITMKERSVEIQLKSLPYLWKFERKL